MINLYPVTKGYFYNIIKISALLLSAAIILNSCAVSKPTYLFKDIVRDTVIKNFSDTDIELKIKKNDILNLTISSLNPLEDVFFNMGIPAAMSTSSSKTDLSGSGYLVNLDGNIYLHKIGSVMVAGSTRNAIKQKLEAALLPYLKDPIVTLSFANHFVTVMGALGASQVINMPAEKITLIDAIALTATVTADASLKNVLVIRETPNAKEFKHLNLENGFLITSPWYFLQPKDIVVINPNVEKIFRDAQRTKNQQLLATIFSGLSIAVIILDRIIRK